MQNLDRQVFALLAKDVLELLADDLACPVMRVDDVVANLELNMRERLGGIKILVQVLFH